QEQGEHPVCLALSPSDSLLAMGLQGRTVRVHDTKNLSGEPLRTFEAMARSLAFSPDEKTLAIGSVVNWVHLFAMEGQEVRHLRVEGNLPVGAVTFDSMGTKVAAGTAARSLQAAHVERPVGQVYLWDLNQRTPRGTLLQKHTGGVAAVAF